MLRESFDKDWYLESEGSSERIGPVTLPFDAMIREERDPSTPNAFNTGFYPGGTYRYSKTFTAPTEWSDQYVGVEFEGVYMRSEVFLNGTSIASRPNGYVEFVADLSGPLKPGEENLIEVVVRNDEEPNSRWYSGSGIYRPTHLLVADRVHIGPRGLRVTTRKLTADAATIAVEVDVIGHDPASSDLSVQIEILDSSLSPVATTTARVESRDGAGPSAHADVVVQQPSTWSAETPRLYWIRARLERPDGDVAVDRFGIRTIEVDARRGLRINGEGVKLRGACIHHDNGVIGANELDAAAERRIRLLKEAGYNAIRSAHNPISAALLRACDSQGMYVMDELTDVWSRPKVVHDSAREFDAWWSSDLAAMIAADFNHPSVIMYSIGNEIGQTWQPSGLEATSRLASFARDADPSRPITNGVNPFLNVITASDEKQAKTDAKALAKGDDVDPLKNVIAVMNVVMSTLEKVMPRIAASKSAGKRTSAAHDLVDVAGYNYAQRRYRKDGVDHPERVIVGTESTGPQVNRHWREIETLPHVIGDFVWTGWDYLGEAGVAVKRYSQPRRIFLPFPALLAGTPIIDITGHRQTQSYVNEIVWRTRSRPVLAVQPVNHSGEKVTATSWRASNSISSWSWEGYEGRSAAVEVYADAPRVELRLNGRLIGRKPADQSTGFLAMFTVPYEPGELTAIAYDSSGAEIGREALVSADPTTLRLEVRPEVPRIFANGHDLVHVPIHLTDASGVLRPLADRGLEVEVTGAGSLAGFGSANPITPEGFAGSFHETYHGRALAVVRAGLTPGQIKITVRGEGLAPVEVTIPVLDAGDRADDIHYLPGESALEALG